MKNGEDETDPNLRETLEVFEIVHEFDGRYHTVVFNGSGIPRFEARARLRFLAFARVWKQLYEFYENLAEEERAKFKWPDDR